MLNREVIKKIVSKKKKISYIWGRPPLIFSDTKNRCWPILRPILISSPNLIKIGPAVSEEFGNKLRDMYIYVYIMITMTRRIVLVLYMSARPVKDMN